MEIMTKNSLIRQAGSKPRKWRDVRLCLEALESRLAPANVFVVPVNQLPDATHLYTLADAELAAGAGGTVTTFTTNGGGDSSWSDAGNVTGDAVLTQTEKQYDADGNAILTTTRDRFHD